MPQWLARLYMIIIIIGIPPLLVLSNVMILATPQFVDYEYAKPDFPPSQRFNAQDRRYFATESFLFERGDRNFEQFKGLGVYNDRELNHMVDVRVLVAQSSVFIVMSGLLILILLVALLSTAATRQLAPQGLFGGAVLTLALFGALGVFAAILFDTFFFYFHIVFFQGNSGFFSYTDSLIQFYPERFWFDAAIVLVGLTLVEAIVLGVLAWGWRKAIAERGSQPVSSTPLRTIGS